MQLAAYFLCSSLNSEAPKYCETQRYFYQSMWSYMTDVKIAARVHLGWEWGQIDLDFIS